jgi:protocatechuate 3,4-dioxygenase beta subunit
VVSIPAGGLVDVNGGAVTGEALLRMSSIDVNSPEVLAAPGDFSATTEAGAEAQLETFAMAEFQVLDAEGNPLKIKAGETLTVEMLLPEDTTLTENEEVPAWHFDEASGKWIEEGTGVVHKYSQNEDRLAFVTQVSHFSWWNCDKEMETTCVSGTVLDCEGKPASGADLMIDSDQYDGNSSGFGTADGSFCILARTDSEVRVMAAHGVGQQRVAATATVTTGSAPSQCPGACTTANIQLPCTPEESDLDCDDSFFVGCKACLKGRVVTEDGDPVPYAVVDVSTGSTGFKRLADAQGNYCTPAALDSLTSIQGKAANASAGLVSFTATQPGTCPSCEVVPDLVLKPQDQDDLIPTDTCVSAVGGVTLTSVVGNGVHQKLLNLDSGWGSVTRAVNADDGTVTLTMDLFVVSSEAAGALYGQPWVNFSLQITEAVTGARTYTLTYLDGDPAYTFNGRAAAALGDVVGLGNETFRLDDDQDFAGGSVTFDGAFGAVGTTAAGSFLLRFAPDCAREGASLQIRGTFSLPVFDNASLYQPGGTGTIDMLTYLKCSLLSLYAWASGLEQIFVGVVQMELDAQPMTNADGSPFGSATYRVETDTLGINMYADDSVSISVVAPGPGENAVTTASLFTNTCYYTTGAGTVTVSQFGDPTVTTWWAGSFSVVFAEGMPTSEGAICPTRTATGTFGAAVCQ